MVDDIWARMPNSSEAEMLQLELGTPVVVYVRVGYDESDTPVRVAVSVLPCGQTPDQIRAGKPLTSP